MRTQPTSAVTPLPPLEPTAAPVLAPRADAPVDHFDAQAETLKLNAFKLGLEERKRVKEITDVILTCVPMTDMNGSVEQQVQLLLMRIMANVESQRKKDGLESSKLEALKKDLQSKAALKEVKKLESTINSERQARAEENNRATEGLSSISRAQHEAFMASLREMRQA
jgi:hypothetical protein